MVKSPPSGIDSTAFLIRFPRARSIWLGSTKMYGTSNGTLSVRLIESGGRHFSRTLVISSDTTISSFFGARS